MWWLLLLPISLFAQDNVIDLDLLDKLDDAMPSYQTEAPSGSYEVSTQGPRKYLYPVGEVSMDQIKTSGTTLGSVKAGAILIRLEDDKQFALSKDVYVNFFQLQDEHGFKYISSKGKTRYKISGDQIVSIKEITNLYEPPDQYTPAPKNIIFAEYDKKLRILPEPILYAGFVDGSYMADLFNDKRARYGQTAQFGMRVSAKWDWPVMVGLAFSYERSTYNLINEGKVIYSSPSIGPMFKTKDFVVWDFPFRFQTQYRVSPLARADIQTRNEDLNLKFNSSDFLLSVEHPTKNFFGEFTIGLFFQAQWLNLKDQKTATKLIANNQTNNSYGISLSQVFE